MEVAWSLEWPMRDGILRRALKRAARCNFELSLGLHRGWQSLRGQRHWQLGGACGGCARCCEEPTIQVGHAVWRLRSLRRLFLAWQRHVNGFELERAEPRSRSFVFRCTHFDPVERRCDSYDTRPGMCRDYPRVLLEQANPEFFAECGHRAVASNAELMLAELERQGLSPEQRELLVERLRLR